MRRVKLVQSVVPEVGSCHVWQSITFSSLIWLSTGLRRRLACLLVIMLYAMTKIGRKGLTVCIMVYNGSANW